MRSTSCKQWALCGWPAAVHSDPAPSLRIMVVDHPLVVTQHPCLPPWPHLVIPKKLGAVNQETENLLTHPTPRDPCKTGNKPKPPPRRSPLPLCHIPQHLHRRAPASRLRRCHPSDPAPACPRRRGCTPASTTTVAPTCLACRTRRRARQRTPLGGLGRGGGPRAAGTDEVEGDWGMRCGGRLGRGVEGRT
jgi:hypothetical protein